MKNFTALSAIGLVLASSISHAAFIVDLPERASFDINGPISSFTLDHTYDLDEGNPETLGYLFENNFRLLGFPELPRGEEGPLNQFFGVEDVNAGFQGLLFGRLRGVPGSEFETFRSGGVFPYIELGKEYTFDVFATAYLYDLTDCRSEGEPPFSCNIIDYGPNDSTIITFFDSQATGVPVGPTAPLLAAGLAGLWLHRRKA